MARVPRRISSATSAVLRSRSRALVRARSIAKVQFRWIRGSRLRATWRRACQRSLTTSARVLLKLRAKPLGEARNQAKARRVCVEPRRISTRLIVISERGASPVKMFEIDTPSSASSPRPFVARSSMTRASAGRLATSTRPSSRSYQRNAGTPSTVPCRIPSWLAGVVQGNCGVHSCITCPPVPSHRRMVGTVPDWTAQCSTGNGTPSTWTNSTPGTSGSDSGPARRPRRASELTSASSVPAVLQNSMNVPTPAVTQLARKADQNEPVIAGTATTPPYSRSACPTSATGRTRTQPSRADASTSTGRTSRPATPLTAATASQAACVVADRPGSRASATISATVEVPQATSSRPTSAGRGRPRARSVTGPPRLRVAGSCAARPRPFVRRRDASALLGVGCRPERGMHGPCPGRSLVVPDGGRTAGLLAATVWTEGLSACPMPWCSGPSRCSPQPEGGSHAWTAARSRAHGRGRRHGERGQRTRATASGGAFRGTRRAHSREPTAGVRGRGRVPAGARSATGSSLLRGSPGPARAPRWVAVPGRAESGRVRCREGPHSAVLTREDPMRQAPPGEPAVGVSDASRLPKVGRRAAGALLSSAIVSTAIVVGYFVLPLSSAITTATAFVLAGGLCTVALLLAWHLRSILRSPYPRVRAVAALATTVPIFLVVFATTYFVMSRTDSAQFSEPLSRLDSAYYTVTIFATVGFGDITPVTSAARATTMLQMIGDVILVGLVAQVIVGAMRQGIRRKEAEGSSDLTDDSP